MNKITIFGRLTKDVELKETQSGDSIAVFTIACDGRNKEETSFFNAKAFGKRGETINKYFKKGDPIVASGTMHQNKWQKQDGTNVEIWEVLVDDFAFVAQNNKNKTQQESQEPVEEEQVGELPF